MLLEYKGHTPEIGKNVFIAPTAVVIGANVSVGHGAVVHGCTVEDCTLIGIEAVVLNGAHIMEGSVVASGAVVREGQVVGPLHLVAGVPATMKRTLDRSIIEKNLGTVKTYLKLAGEHSENKTCDPQPQHR